MTLRAVDPSPLRARYTGPASEVGERPELQWLKISRLRIDPRYQRDIGQRGANNILAIAPAFRWSKFGPLIVAPIGEGLFAIVDGQHRATAAALRGFESVPCVIIAADEAEQADAFVAINANVTAMSPLQAPAVPDAELRLQRAVQRRASQVDRYRDQGRSDPCRSRRAHLSQAPIPAEETAPAQPKSVPQVSQPTAPRAAASAGTGPRVITVGREEVNFAGRHVRVTPRAAQLVGLLAKAKPNPIGDDFLIAKLWNVRPSNAGEYLDGLMHELGALKKIGLEARSLKGIGRQIVEITP